MKNDETPNNRTHASHSSHCLGNGSANIDESIRFVLALDCVDALIVGFENTDEILDYNARLLRTVSESGRPR